MAGSASVDLPTKYCNGCLRSVGGALRVAWTSDMRAFAFCRGITLCADCRLEI